jgi:hypothetical protein
MLEKPVQTSLIIDNKVSTGYSYLQTLDKVVKTFSDIHCSLIPSNVGQTCTA